MRSTWYGVTYNARDGGFRNTIWYTGLSTTSVEPLIIDVGFFIYLFFRSLLRLTTAHSVTTIGLATQRMCSLFMELQTSRPIFGENK